MTAGDGGDKDCRGDGGEGVFFEAGGQGDCAVGVGVKVAEEVGFEVGADLL